MGLFDTFLFSVGALFLLMMINALFRAFGIKKLDDWFQVPAGVFGWIALFTGPMSLIAWALQ